MDLQTFGGRRFLLTLGCGAINAALVWFGKLDGGSYTAITLGTVAVYIGGNTWQKREQIRAGGVAAP